MGTGLVGKTHTHPLPLTNAQITLNSPLPSAKPTQHNVSWTYARKKTILNIATSIYSSPIYSPPRPSVITHAHTMYSLD
jgi:hypothetical protein